MKRLTILIYEPYPFSEVAGNLRTQSYIMKFADQARFRLVLLSPRETGFTEKMKQAGIDTVVEVPSQSADRYGGKCLQDGFGGKFRTLWALLRYNLRLMSVFRSKRVDLVYCNSIRAVLTVGWASLLTGTPVLWYIKGSLNNPFLDFIGFLVSKKILFFCESNKNDRYPLLVKWFGSKIQILKIGINPEVIESVEAKDRTTLQKELDISERRINIIVLGQLYRPKGVHFLVEALGKIVGKFPDVRLYVVGNHIIEEYRAYKDELLALIERHRLREKVVFTGWRRDALEITSLMDILVHPSLTEGFGRAVLEAMALGKPVVATKVGGLREIIKDGENGFLVDLEDPQAIADRLSQLLADRALRDRFGREAKKTVFSDYLLPDKIKQLEQIWAETA